MVREWCISLGVLTAISMSRQEAELKLGAFMPLLMKEFPDEAFTADSLAHVARQCARGFPSYGELVSHLSAWWRENRPKPPAIAAPKPQDVPTRRPAATEAELEAVHAIVDAVRAGLSIDAPSPPPIAKPLQLSPEALLAQYDRLAQEAALPGLREAATIRAAAIRRTLGAPDARPWTP